MKYVSCFLCCFLGMNFMLQAQTEKEAKKLYAEKKYEAAGKMYYEMYQFEEAAAAFQKRIDFIQKTKNPDTVALNNAAFELEKAKNASRMLSNCEDIQIIDSVIIDKSRFLTAYFLSEESGYLFPSGNQSVIFENQLKDLRYFGKKDHTQHFRIYSQVKIDENWSEEKQLNIPTEEKDDINYPFFLPDGLTIYFASTGTGSIGGYDIFVTRYNLNSDSYLHPNQLGMPFNSIYNDYMLAIDEEYGIGYFVSDRFQEQNKVIVYTFIPNENYISLENLSGEKLINRAKITAIRDSWKSGGNYASLIENIKSDIEKRKQSSVQKDFTFVINDNIIYHVLSDFESDAAKRSFMNAQELKKQIIELEQNLEDSRKQYAISKVNGRKNLNASILKNEQKLESYYPQLKELEKNARNLEIKYLRQNQ